MFLTTNVIVLSSANSINKSDKAITEEDFVITISKDKKIASNIFGEPDIVIDHFVTWYKIDGTHVFIKLRNAGESFNCKDVSFAIEFYLNLEGDSKDYYLSRCVIYLGDKLNSWDSGDSISVCSKPGSPIRLSSNHQGRAKAIIDYDDSINEGDGEQNNIAYHITKHAAIINGKVKKGTIRAVSDALVFCMIDTVHVCHYTFTDSAGNFELYVPSENIFTLTAQKDGLTFTSKTCGPLDEGQEITIDPIKMSRSRSIIFNIFPILQHLMPRILNL